MQDGREEKSYCLLFGVILTSSTLPLCPRVIQTPRSACPWHLAEQLFFQWLNACRCHQNQQNQFSLMYSEVGFPGLNPSSAPCGGLSGAAEPLGSLVCGLPHRRRPKHLRSPEKHTYDSQGNPHFDKFSCALLWLNDIQGWECSAHTSNWEAEATGLSVWGQSGLHKILLQLSGRALALQACTLVH